jgi:hypothetical protein
VKVLKLTILSPGRPDLVLPIPFERDDKGYAFALKDGSPYSFRFSFIVSNNIVSGLKYTNTVWKTGVKGNNNDHICLALFMINYYLVLDMIRSGCSVHSLSIVHRIVQSVRALVNSEFY